MTPTHLIPEDLLMAYAAGTAGEALSLLAACHLTLSPESRAQLQTLEAVGGELIAELPPADLAPGSLEAMLARLEKGQEQRRLEKIFGIERAKASERIMRITEEHEAVLAKKMVQLELK